MKKVQNPVKSALIGLAIGDALGVPVEFQERKTLKKKPVKDMMGYGTHNQPAGTWSDDSSLTFCLAESLCNGYDLINIAQKLTDWIFGKLWRPHGEIFDIGIQTRKALREIKQFLKYEEYEALKLLRYETNEWTNGNGSLMRILPLLFYIKDKPLTEKFEIIWDVSALTHPHIRSAMACLIYLELAENILNGQSKILAYQNMQTSISTFFKKQKLSPSEIMHFDRILTSDISKLQENVIKSDGYVIHSLEASLWCFLTTKTFETSVLKAVNLGSDTDTTGAIVGGLAGLYYGYNQLPEFWVAYLTRLEDILALCDRLERQYL
jgi:ADP-ribosylglycohydrolase